MAVSELHPPDAPLRIAVPPSACRTAVDHIGWHETLAVEAGPYVLGVRTNSAAAAELLRELLGERVVDAEDVDPNLSVYLAPPAANGDTQDLHRLYLGHHRALRSRDPGRVVAGLGGYLDAHARAFDDEHPLVLAAAVVADGRAHVLPHRLRRGIVDQERRWRERGVQLVDLPWVAVDLARAEVVVPPPTLVLGEQQRAALQDAVAVPIERDIGVEPGRYPLATWSPGGSDSAGGRVLAAARSVVNLRDVDAGALLPVLRDVLAEVPDGGGFDALRGLLADD